MSGCIGVCVYGCMGVWVYGCMGVWVYGCTFVHLYIVYCKFAIFDATYFHEIKETNFTYLTTIE